MLNGLLIKKQSVFLGGRNFFNGVVVSYEVIDEAKRKKKENCLIFKVDFEKACDSVSWDFVFYTL